MKVYYLLFFACILFFSSCTQSINYEKEDFAPDALTQCTTGAFNQLTKNISLSHSDILMRCSLEMGIVSTRLNQTFCFVDSLLCPADSDLTRSAITSVPYAYAVYCSELEKTLIVSAFDTNPFILGEINGRVSFSTNNECESIFVDAIKNYYESKVLERNDEVKINSMFIDDNSINYILSTQNPSDRLMWEQRFVTKDTLYKYGPYTKTCWHQNPPYNSSLDPVLVDSDNYVLPPAGCTAVAIAQILAVFKQPSHITVVSPESSETYDWEGDWQQMTSVPSICQLPSLYKKQIADLMYIIGKGVKMRYTPTGGASGIQLARNFFTNHLGFGCGQIQPYSFGAITSSLSLNSPLYCSGNDTSDGTGHAFVIDGSYEARSTVRYIQYVCRVDNPSVPINPLEWRVFNDTTIVSSTEYISYNLGEGVSSSFSSQILQEYNNLTILPNILPQ